MSSPDCQWLHGGQQVDDRAYTEGITEWVPAAAVMVVGGPAFGSIRRRRPRWNTGRGHKAISGL
jgi:hypothetical protein